MSCGVGRRRGSDLALVWLWRRLEATAPIRPLAWEPPHAAGAAQEMAKDKKNKIKLKLKNKKKKLINCLELQLKYLFHIWHFLIIADIIYTY